MGSLLTVQEVAARLHCHPHTVRRWIWAGRLRGVKVGDLVRVPEAEVAQFPRPVSVGARTRTPDSAGGLRKLMRRLRGKDVAGVRLLERLIAEGDSAPDWRDPLA